MTYQTKNYIGQIDSVLAKAMDEKVLGNQDIDWLIIIFESNPILCRNWKNFHRALPGLKDSDIDNLDFLITVRKMKFEDLFRTMMEGYIAGTTPTVKDLWDILMEQNNKQAADELATEFERH